MSTDPGFDPSTTAPPSNPPMGFEGGVSGGPGYSQDPGAHSSAVSTPPPGFDGGMSSEPGHSHDPGQGGSSFSPPPGFADDSPYSSPPGFTGDPSGDTRRPEGQQTEQQIAQELEQRTGKSIGELILSLGHGPVRMDVRQLERALEDNGTIRHRIEDHTPPKVIDNVTVPHPYQDRRYVTEGRVGTEEQVDRAQEIGRDQVAKDFVSGMMSGLRGGAKTGESPQPLGAGRNSDSAKTVTTDAQAGSHLHPTGHDVAPDPPSSR
jgi:hypothetical protein